MVTPVDEPTKPVEKEPVEEKVPQWKIQAEQAKAVYRHDINCVRERVHELLLKYPGAENEITKALDVSTVFNDRGLYTKQELNDLFNPDELLKRHTVRVQNQSFAEQKKIQKILVEEAGGDESDYESDVEEIAPPKPSTAPDSETTKQQQPQYTKPPQRIFKYLNIIDKSVLLPPKEKKEALTVFMEVDDFLVHTYICDENFGYMANPDSKDPEHEFFLEETRQPVLVYRRDCLDETLEFFKKARADGLIEPIVYTSAQKSYTESLLSYIDPENEIFAAKLYQNACYTFEKPDEDISVLMKDISRFQNRDMRRSVIIDPRPISFLMTPENGYPVTPYNAEFNTQGQDTYLRFVMGELREMYRMEDVRPHLDSKFAIRRGLKAAKLI